MQKPMNDVEDQLLIGFYFMLFGIGKGCFWADIELTLIFGEGKGDDVSGGRILKKLLMKLFHMTVCNKDDRKCFIGFFFEVKDSLGNGFYSSFFASEGQIFLGVMKGK